MSFEQNTAQQSILTSFFEFIRSEDFEACFHWAKKQLQGHNSAAFNIINQLEAQPKISKAQLINVENNELLLMFCTCYGFARHEVEETNRYCHAETLIRSGITALELLPSSEIINALKMFAGIQIEICCIDRGIYTSQEFLMAQATKNIANTLSEITALKAELSPADCQLYAEHFALEFSSYQYYSEGVAIIAQLLEIRWGEPETLALNMRKLRPKFLAAVQALGSNGKYIMSTDLEALWPPLTFFSENRAPGTGKLIVERGAITISYFASVNHIVINELLQSLSNIITDAPKSHLLYLEQWGAETPVRNMLNDTWAGIAREFENIYSWQLPSLSTPFRNRNGSDKALCFAVELIYYPMGIFALTLKADLDGVSGSGVRHAMSLGTPFAMDQQMHWHNEDIGLLEDFAENRFTEVAAVLNGTFKHGEQPINDILTFNKTDNRFVSTLIDRVVECVDDKYIAVTAKSLKSHFAYPLFILPQRELRSAVDDWCLRTPPLASNNLNQDCFNHDEFFYINQHECVLGLLQQPNWVLDQSAEMIDVAAAINNLFHLTNKLLDKQLSVSQVNSVQKLNDKKLSAKVLREQVKKLTIEDNCLKQFTRDAHWLLELISAGSMMTFPDHTRLIQKVFDRMGFEKLHIRTQETLDKIQFRQDEIIAENAKLYEKLRTRNSKRLTRIISGSMGLISVGALKDIFDIINSSNLGIKISGPLQVSIVTLFAMMLIILLLNKSGSDK